MPKDKFLQIFNMLGFGGVSAISLLSLFMTIPHYNNLFGFIYAAVCSIIIIYFIMIFIVWRWNKLHDGDISFAGITIGIGLTFSLTSLVTTILHITDFYKIMISFTGMGVLGIGATIFYYILADRVGNKEENRVKREEKEYRKRDSERTLARRNIEYMKYLERLTGRRWY